MSEIHEQLFLNEQEYKNPKLECLKCISSCFLIAGGLLNFITGTILFAFGGFVLIGSAQTSFHQIVGLPFMLLGAAVSISGFAGCKGAFCATEGFTKYFYGINMAMLVLTTTFFIINIIDSEFLEEGFGQNQRIYGFLTVYIYIAFFMYLWLGTATITTIFQSSIQESIVKGDRAKRQKIIDKQNQQQAYPPADQKETEMQDSRPQSYRNTAISDLNINPEETQEQLNNSSEKKGGNINIYLNGNDGENTNIQIQDTSNQNNNEFQVKDDEEDIDDL